MIPCFENHCLPFFIYISFERPESPTLPPEQGLPLGDNSLDLSTPIFTSAPTSPIRYKHIDTSMPPPPPPTSSSKYIRKPLIM
jgi:hypothetical protein